MIFISAAVHRNHDENNGGSGQKADSWRKFSVVIFAIGAIIGLVLIGLSVYADFEASLFDVTISTDGTIRPVYCPVFIEVNESGEVQATVHNQYDGIDEILVEAHITHGQISSIRKQEYKISLAPDEKKRISWDLYPADATEQQIILTRLIVSGSVSETTYKGSCGVLVLNLPGEISGTHLFWLLFSIAAICLWSGIGMWMFHRQPYSGRRIEATSAILGLGIFIQAGLILAAVGCWELAALSFYLVVLWIGVIIPHFFIKRKKLNI